MYTYKRRWMKTPPTESIRRFLTNPIFFHIHYDQYFTTTFLIQLYYDCYGYRYRRCLFFLPERSVLGLFGEVPLCGGEWLWMKNTVIARLFRRTFPNSPIPHRESVYIEKEPLCPHGTKRLFFCLIFGVEGTLPRTHLDDVAIGGELL